MVEPISNTALRQFYREIDGVPLRLRDAKVDEVVYYDDCGQRHFFRIAAPPHSRSILEYYDQEWCAMAEHLRTEKLP